MTVSVRAESMTGSLRLHALVERFWEIGCLSVLWAVGCIPLLTAGASTRALFEVVAQRRRGDARPVARAFLAEFTRAPLIRALVTVLTLLALVGSLSVLALGIRLADPVLATASQAAGLAGLAVVSGAVVITLPLRADRPDETFGETLRTGFLIGLGRPLTTVAAVLLTGAALVATVLFPPLLLVAGWAWAALVTALVHSSVRRLGGNAA